MQPMIQALISALMSQALTVYYWLDYRLLQVNLGPYLALSITVSAHQATIYTCIWIRGDQNALVDGLVQVFAHTAGKLHSHCCRLASSLSHSCCNQSS